MRSGLMSRARARAAVVGAGALTLSLVSAQAGAAVVPGEDAAALAAAMAGTAPIAGASLVVDYDCVADDPVTTDFDEAECPTGIGDTEMAGFPRSGPTFAIITSGNAAYADDANESGSLGQAWGKVATEIGASVRDHQIVKVDLGAATGNCLAFDFRFLSEEFPEFLNKGYNDAFIAQLNTWSVTADEGQDIVAPGNFAAGAGDVISVDGAGPSGMTAEYAAGTTYDGATLPLVARTPVTPGSTNSLYLTIFDQGDASYDSAVFVDNLRFETLDAGLCKSLALDPFEGSTGATVPPGTTGAFGPGLSTFSIPLNSNLPTGPIDTELTATSAFVDWGDAVPRKVAARLAMKATTNFGTGSAKIPAGGSGNLVINTSPEGIGAVNAAIQLPATLMAKSTAAKKKAKKLTKKAKKLKKKAKKAPAPKAKKLKKKAKKLQKKAKKQKKAAAAYAAQSTAAAGSPLGTVVVTMSNPSNGKTETLRFQIPR